MIECVAGKKQPAVTIASNNNNSKSKLAIINKILPAAVKLVISPTLLDEV